MQNSFYLTRCKKVELRECLQTANDLDSCSFLAGRDESFGAILHLILPQSFHRVLRENNPEYKTIMSLKTLSKHRVINHMKLSTAATAGVSFIMFSFMLTFFLFFFFFPRIFFGLIF